MKPDRFPAPGSAVPGAPPPLRRALASSDAVPEMQVLPVSTASVPGTTSLGLSGPVQSRPARRLAGNGLLIGLGLAVAALVVETSGRSRRRHT